jgi:hypothetical protein
MPESGHGPGKRRRQTPSLLTIFIVGSTLIAATLWLLAFWLTR